MRPRKRSKATFEVAKNVKVAKAGASASDSANAAAERAAASAPEDLNTGMQKIGSFMKTRPELGILRK
eukprot:gene17120-23423_t